MKKAKTNSKIFTILSAILGVVFAFMTGVTYCVNSLNLIYGTKPESTTAYLGNQQYHIVNDTLENPIIFGEGSHNFEIALQYAFDYAFDVRLKYEMTWSVGVKQTDGTYDKTATNVILNFANRDNIIYDEEYIYLANSVSAGNGKLTFITGVDFVDTQDATYFGQTLKINITEIKIYKSQTSYTDSHILMKKTVVDEETQEETLVSLTTPAAQAWLYNKQKATATTAYVMMYNYRRNYANGIPYPGLETAYKKPVGSTNLVSGSAWAGGNRAYAGTGMYIITGTSAVKMQIEVAGIWRDSDGNMNKDVISENSIQYNYTSDWIHSSWDSARLWETRTFNFVIPANKACYIDILDSVEITSAGRIATNLYDSYRMVTNKITINPGLEDNSGTSLATEFLYTESNNAFIQIKTLNSNPNVTSSTNYSQKDIDVVNTSVYSNGLYSANVSSASEQTFNTNISLINNTNSIKTVAVTYELWYHISNAQINLTDTITQDEETTYKRAEEYVSDNTYTKAYAFASSNLYYTDNVNATTHLSSIMTTSVTISPYSSVNIAESYKVAAALQESISSTYDTSSTDGKTDYYDVWTYLVVTTATETTANEANMAIESTVSENLLSLSVKNNTDKTITGVIIDDISVKEMSNASYQALNTQPSDWTASYWKYYTRSGTEGSYVYTKLTSDPITTENPFVADTYFVKSQSFSEIKLSVPTGFTQTGSTIYNSTLVLQPGESAVFATATTSATSNVMVSGIAKASCVFKIETEVNGTAVKYSITNNSGKTITGITVRSFSVKDGESNAVSYNLATGFTQSGDIISNSTLTLAKNASVEFAASTITAGTELTIQGIAMANIIEDSTSMMLINNGKSSAYLINYSDSSYYVRFSGTYTGSNSNITTTTNYNYYIGIVRPGQILNVPMSTSGTLSVTEATDNYSSTTLTTAGWETTATNLMTKYFALVKS